MGPKLLYKSVISLRAHPIGHNHKLHIGLLETKDEIAYVDFHECFVIADKMVKSNVALLIITHFLILFISIYCEYKNKS